ncbi:MAG: ribosomal-processing cysteine protease Prp [Clostridia bacterium]|nr:ribosomal-processing cysteine protease Prp [Clostridia bacterium]
MIKVVFFIKGENISGFSITGHAEYRESNDIVCASVTSAALMTANTVTDIIKADADASAEDGSIKLKVKKDSDMVQTVLKGFKLHIKELAKEYPENIKVIYGGVK